MICANCGKPNSEHSFVTVWHNDGHGNSLACICPTSLFLAEPEPLKANAGVRYQHNRFAGYDVKFAVGLANGRLCLAVNPEFKDLPDCDMSPDWKEVL